MNTKIYALCEPDGRIRYIGKTIKKLSKRLSEHLAEARREINDHSYKNNWIRSMFKKGLLPTIQLIGEVEGNGCKEEVAWIMYFKEGVKLTNGTEGGEGVLGHKHSLETKEKLRLANTGNHHTEATRIKIGLTGLGRNKGRIHTPENNEKNRLASLARHLKHTDITKKKCSLASKQWWADKKRIEQQESKLFQ